ncbi:MAG: cytochrome c biogenesis CcdA family protein [Myxococcota bacterium]
MIEGFLTGVESYIHSNPWLAVVSVFVGGALTASNPCVLAMIPLMMSFIVGKRDSRAGVGQAFGFSLVFVMGLAITFTVLGLLASLGGRLYGDVSSAWNYVVAVVCLIMGLHLAEMISLPIPSLGDRFIPKYGGLIGMFLLGLIFGVVSAPCAAPILIVLLAYLAGGGSSVLWGALLLLVYALGHSALILIAGTSMGAARALIENKRMRSIMGVLRRIAGATIVLVGFYFAYLGWK